ncbi:MAG: toxin-antitoxin system YwqK family antitoxin, partial [Saprospiraceae bacterium]
MKNFILLLTTIVFFACGEPSAPAPTVATTGDFTGYEIAKISGSEIEKAIKKNAQTGQLIEDGFISNGRKTGAWTTYHPSNNLTVYTVTNYVDGKKEGLYLEAETSNRVKTIGSYANDVKHGKWITYNFS